MCVCVCACVRVLVCVCVRVCVYRCVLVCVCDMFYLYHVSSGCIRFVYLPSGASRPRDS